VTNLEKCVIEFRDKLYVVNASTFVEQNRFCIGKMECERGVMSSVFHQIVYHQIRDMILICLFSVCFAR